MARAIVCVLLAFAAAAANAATTTVTDVPTARGAIRIAHYRPDLPLANLYVIHGGDGLLQLQADGTGIGERYVFSPLLRIRQQLLDAGISLVFIDAPSDMQTFGIPLSHRTTPGHSAELLEVLRVVQQRDNLPAWVLGYSAGAPSAGSIAIRAPGSTPFGLILMSPNTVLDAHLLTLDLEAIQRPTLLLTHALDSCDVTPPSNGPLVMSRVSAAEQRRHVVFTGGSAGSRGGGCDSTGHHGFGGVDAQFASELIGWMREYASLAQPANYQGLWWRSPAGQESGWGVNITHQGEILFATWFTYDTDGSGMWLVMSNGARTGPGAYAGELYRTTGPAFSASPWAGPVTVTPVGNASFTFTDANNGTFSYTANNVTQSKPITKQVFSIVPSCLPGVPHTPTPNYSALWWASPPGSESGWGLNIAHQGDILFATWFTYAANGRGQWLVVTDGQRTGPGTYSGQLYRTAGPPFSLSPWQGNVTVTPVGTATFTFSGADNGTFAYTLDGVTQSKAITRQVYANPQTVCR